jgi:hypothetical protein
MSRRQEALSPNTPPETLRVFILEDPELAPWVAMNPNAPFDLLTRFEQSDNLWVLAGLARNPKSSLSTLQNIIQRCPKAFFPPTPNRLDWKTLKLAPFPEALLMAILEQHQTPASFLCLAATHTKPAIRAKVAKHANTPEETLALLSRDPQSEVKAAVAQNPKTAEGVLTRLFTEASTTLRASLARNPNCPLHILTALVTETYLSGEMAVALVSQKSLSGGLLLRLLGHLDSNGRRRAASHPNATTELLSTLCRDNDARVLCEVAKNPKTSPAALLVLACNADAKIRHAVTQNPAAPEEALHRLLRDPQETLRRAAVVHPNIPAEFRALLRRLWLRDDLSGFAEPHATLSLFDLETIERYGSWGLTLVARHPQLPNAVMIYLAGHQAPSVRCALARNPSINEAVLSILARDVDQQVRMVVSLHPLLPHSLREALLTVGEPVLFDATKLSPIRPITPEVSELRQIAARFSSTESRLRALVDDAAWYVRFAVARNPNASADMLELLSKDHDPRVRRAIAQNPRTPYYAIENLARDPQPGVREAALSLLQSSANTVSAVSSPKRHRFHTKTRSAMQPPSYLQRRPSASLQWTRWQGKQ